MFKILRFKRIWGHEFDLLGSRDVIGDRSRDHLIAHMPFPVSGPLEPSLYSRHGLRDIQRRM